MKHCQPCGPRPGQKPSRVLLLALWGLFAPFPEDGVRSRLSAADVAPPDSRADPRLPAIRSADMKEIIETLSSRRFGGRRTGTRGFDEAARHCASLFERLGVGAGVPGRGDNEPPRYLQDFHFVLRSWRESSHVQIRSGDNLKRFGVEHLASRGHGDVDWSGPWALVIYRRGQESKIASRLTEEDCRGHIPIVIPAAGQEDEPSEILTALQDVGFGRVVVHSKLAVEQRRGMNSREILDERVKAWKKDGGTRCVYISNALAEHVLENVDVGEKEESRDDTPTVALLRAPDIHLKLEADRQKKSSRNVLAVIEGSDPELRREFVAVGAHLDHLGETDDDFYPGADDNGSGCAAVISLARAFAKSPVRPRKSILFILFSGEENGLLGSYFYVQNPTVPLDRMRALVQLDMIGRDEEHLPDESVEDNKNTVHLVGVRQRSPELHKTIVEQNRSIGLDFEYDEEALYERSDQYHFGEAGVPVVFFFTGFHPDYHTSRDTPDKINYPKLERITKLVCRVMWTLVK